MTRNNNNPAPPPGEQAIDTHDWQKFPPALQARDLARNAAVSKLVQTVRKQDGSLDETLLPGPDDPIQVPIIVESARFVVSLAWCRAVKWAKWLVQCPECGRWCRALLLVEGLRCKRCAGVKARSSYCPKILRPILRLTNLEQWERKTRKIARIAGRQRFREGVTVGIEV
jgi:hypothetical protein